MTYLPAALFVAIILLLKFRNTDTTEPNAASKSQRAAAMGKRAGTEHILVPETEDEAVEFSVKAMLNAAHLLCRAADLCLDGDVVSHYINSAIRLRDLANSLAPDRPEWPANVIPFMPRKL